MIADKVRTLSYKKAIEDNVKKDNVVLDIGCGTGILSFFAAKQGCKKVYAVDKSDIIEDAIGTAKLNNLDRHIEFIKSDILKFKPKKKIDVLIHDQIGCVIWDEGFISKVRYIRDNYLKKNGIIIPFKLELYLVPVNYKFYIEEDLSFWRRKKYGIDFSNLGIKEFVQNRQSYLTFPLIGLKDTNTFLCKEKLVCTIDLRKDRKVPKKIMTTYKLKKNSKLTGICGYFKVYLDKKNFFSTKPQKTNTHWKQIFLPCLGEKKINKPSVLNFTLFPSEDIRKLRFKFDIVDKTY
jgi:protein arginine N-methyltransferase 1